MALIGRLPLAAAADLEVMARELESLTARFAVTGPH